MFSHSAFVILTIEIVTVYQRVNDTSMLAERISPSIVSKRVSHCNVFRIWTRLDPCIFCDPPPGRVSLCRGINKGQRLYPYMPFRMCWDLVGEQRFMLSFYGHQRHRFPINRFQHAINYINLANGIYAPSSSTICKQSQSHCIPWGVS